MFKSLAHDVECCLSVCFLSHFKFWPLMAIEQWRFFNVQHLLWNVPIIYNCHPRWPVALKPVAEPRSPARKAIALPLRHRGWWRQMLYIIESLVHFTCNKCFKCTYIKLILEKGRHSNKLKYRGKNWKNRNNKFLYCLHEFPYIYKKSNCKFDMHSAIDKQ